MKKITFYAAAFACLTLFSSCEETESVLYNPGDGSTDVLVSFGATSVNLPITVDATGSVDVTVNVSSLSTTDRTVGLMLGEPTSSPAIPGSFTIPSSVTIPANSYTGTFTITGVDVPGVETDPLSFRVMLVDEPNFSEGSPLNVSVFQICPVPSTFFVGNYQLQNLTQVFNGRPNFGAGIFTVEAPDETTRTFTTTLLGTAANPGPNYTVTLNLICNEIIINPSIPIGLACTAGNPVTYGAATTASTYDVNAGDQLFIINFNLDTTDSCGGPFEDQSFILTKI